MKLNEQHVFLELDMWIRSRANVSENWTCGYEVELAIEMFSKWICGKKDKLTKFLEVNRWIVYADAYTELYRIMYHMYGLVLVILRGPFL